MKVDERQAIVQLEYGEYVSLLVCRRPLKRLWPKNRHEAPLRGALRDAKTGAIYTPRLERVGQAPREK